MMWSTPTDVLEQEIIPALNHYVEDYDLEALKDELVEMVLEFNEDGIQISNPMYKMKDLTEDEFNQVLMRHDISASK